MRKNKKKTILSLILQEFFMWKNIIIFILFIFSCCCIVDALSSQRQSLGLQYEFRRIANFNYQFINQRDKELWKEYMDCLKKDFEEQNSYRGEFYYSACQELSGEDSK